MNSTVAQIVKSALKPSNVRFYGTAASRRSVNHETKHVDIKYTDLFIDGQNVKAQSGRTFPVYNPTNGKEIARVQEADASDVDRAIEAGKRAEKAWAKMDGSVRGVLLNKWANLIEKHRDYIVELEALDNGKPVSLAKGDVFLTLNCLRYYAGFSDKIVGQTINSDGDVFSYTMHEPIGTVGAIVPWNFPLLMFAWKVFPALATGNTVVIKPAETTPLSALYVANLAKEAGFPNGVLNVIPGYGAIAGEALARSEKIEKIAFTGSTLTGKKILQASAETNLKKVTLELGGKSPLIIMRDAVNSKEDLQRVVKTAYDGIFYNQGQVCTASSRVFVDAKIYDDFVNTAGQYADKRVVGNPFENVEQGPQNSEMQLKKILHYIDAGQKEGAKLVSGGKRIGDKGYFVEPTVFADVKDHHSIATDEIFGPVVSVLKYDSVEEVIERANKTSYGLAAGVVTSRLDNAMKVTRALKAGTVWVNTWNSFHHNVPFGGYKQSGFGRDLGEYALQNYVNIKAVTIAVPGLKDL